MRDDLTGKTVTIKNYPIGGGKFLPTSRVLVHRHYMLGSREVITVDLPNGRVDHTLSVDFIDD